MTKSHGLPPRFRARLGSANGVVCPGCGNGTSNVTDSRPSEGHMRRRRVCTKCTVRYTTYEITEQEYAHIREMTRNLNKIRTPLITLLTFTSAEPTDDAN